MYLLFIKMYLSAKHCLKNTINYKGMWFKKTIAKWSQCPTTETVYLFKKNVLF